MPGRRKVRLGPVLYPTTRELVLLYLLDRFEVDRDSPQADFLTQEAMMRELRISKAQVSRLVQEGTEVGHLEMGRGRPGRRKRQRTYTLSQKGRIQAEALRETMARAELRVVPPDGKEERRLLRD
ncbi:MAG TPA: hypothetical protein VJ397_02510, partial [Thermoplasmata archaeon]|nr:hypothetical protein [Thermoplasmata archaeon]